MSTYSRRIIYLSDKEWEDVKRYASDDGITASAYIRHAVEGLTSPRIHPVISDPIVEDGSIVGFTDRDQFGERGQVAEAVDRVSGIHRPVIVGATPQQKRDAILRRVNKGA